MRPTLPFRVTANLVNTSDAVSAIKAFCPISLYYDIMLCSIPAFSRWIAFHPADRSVVLIAHIFMQGVRFLWTAGKRLCRRPTDKFYFLHDKSPDI